MNLRHCIRTVVVSTAIASTVMTLIPTSAYARDRGPIKFARGSASKTFTATTRVGDADCWSFSALEGQTATAKVTGTSRAAVQIDPREYGSYDDITLQIEETGVSRDSRPLEWDGRHEVCVAVITGSRPAAYKLTLTIL